MAYDQHLPGSVVWLLWVIAAATISPGHLHAHAFADSVVRIEALSADGSSSFGSGVVIAHDLVASACHVIRDATTIDVTHGGSHWDASVESGSLVHDLCLVSVPGLDLPAVSIRASQSLRLGERVIAAGFPGGGDLAVREGELEGLYAYEGGNVIRTSATFETGSSGGGLFDEEGALIGVLAFKARTGTKLHFALPADWALPGTRVASLLRPVREATERRAFWEQPRPSQPAFLGVARLEAASHR